MRVLVALVFLAGALGAAPPANETRLVGTWDCEGSAPGFTSTQTYASTADGSLTLTNSVRASSGKTGKVGETFRYDPAAATWSVAAAPNAFFGGLQLSGPPWTGSVWTLSGTEIVLGRSRPVRIVYTDLGPALFRREHQVLASGTWRDDAELVCRRREVAAASPPPGATPPPAPVALASAAPAKTPTPVASPTPLAVHSSAPPLRAPAPPAARTPAPLATLAATPAPKPAPRPRATASGSPPPNSDRAYRLIGAWDCRTITNATSTHTYALERDGSISLRNELRIGAREFVIDESYRFDRTHSRWANETEGGAYRGSAGPWAAQTWSFSGIDTEEGSRIPVRMIYTSLGPGAFKRDFEKLRAGRWMPYASETCRRRGG